MNRVYLDYNASAPLREEAREAMVHAMALAGNPSSVHAEGRQARAIVEIALQRNPQLFIRCQKPWVHLIQRFWLFNH